MKILKTGPGCNLFLGHQGEKLALRIVFDIGPWLETYGFGTAHLLHQRKGDAEPYPVGTVQEGNEVRWDVSDADTAVEGTGRYELHFYTGEALVKSVTGDTLVRGALSYGEDPPEAVQLWLDHVAQEEHKINEAVTASETARDEARTAAGNAEAFEKTAAAAAGNAAAAAQAAGEAQEASDASAKNAKASEESAAKSAEEARKAAESAGMGGADWNAKEGEPGHVLNRTHYTESGRVEVLAEGQIVAAEDGPALPSTPDLKIGETYTVVWNGTEYICVAQDGAAVEAGTIIMGDGTEFGLAGNGEPFLIVTIPAMGANAVAPYDWTDDGTPLPTVAIYQDKTVVHPLDPKYLPEGVPYCVGGGLTELPVTGEWVDESGGDGVNDMFMITAPIGLEIGKTYTVDWNGTKYEAVGLDFNEFSGGEESGVFLGNLVNMGGEDNGLPFMIMELSAEDGAENGCYGMVGGLEQVEVPFTIYSGEGTEIRKLDNRCLDLDWLPTVEKVETEVQGETTVTESGKNMNLKYSTLPIGTNVVVIFDGVRYEGTIERESATGWFVFGNLAIVSAENFADTGEPFLIAAAYESAMYMLYFADENEHTIAVYAVDIQYNVIPDGFLGDKKVSAIDLSTLGMATIATDTTETITTDTSAIIKALDEAGRVPLAFKLSLSSGSGGTMNINFAAVLDGTKEHSNYQWSGLTYQEGWGLFAVIVKVTDTAISVTNRKVM